ncbi:MAG: hypothetical protein LBV20_03290 [Treponema sp.]|nr:hypothetical protein [Treponema sp.]
MFAQSADTRSNRLSYEVTFVGAGLRYERMLGPKFSLSGIAYSAMLPFYADWGIDIVARYYPWGKTFFLGGGLGAHAIAIVSYGYAGIAITPELGWKIDIGKPGYWFIEPYAKMPLTISFIKELGFYPDIPLVFFGIGYSF